MRKIKFLSDRYIDLKYEKVYDVIRYEEYISNPLYNKIFILNEDGDQIYLYISSIDILFSDVTSEYRSVLIDRILS